MGRLGPGQEGLNDDMWRIVFLAILLCAIGVAAALTYGARRWDAGVHEIYARLDAARLRPDPAVYHVQELDGLPAPVQAYFRSALNDGQPIIAAVSMEQTGTMNMSQVAEKWRPFTAAERVVTRRPGFDWEAHIKMMPGVSVAVRDAYVSGEGLLHASLFGLFSLANARGTSAVNEGELIRYFAETAWYPTALLPSQGVSWEAVDDTSARATIKDGEITVTMLFRFNDESLIDSVRVETRPRTVGDEAVPTPWEGHWSEYALRDGMHIPLAGEAAWMTPAGAKPYWRGRITNLRYEYAR